MAIVCSNCDVAPEPGATAGKACSACGERLIAVDTGDDLLGTKIDNRFEVLALVGRGGMGVVYRAKQLSIGREVAIKVLDRRIEKDVDSVKRFFREAKLASTLQHPNTVPIIDFGQSTDGRLYMAMELVRGKTLIEEVNSVGALEIPRLAAIGAQLCDALEVAHDLHIVHRDLKLENVMLVGGKRDHIKILDFGLARSLVDPTTAMTATGLVSGTPRYMAPEVGIEGAPPAPTQDMYSIGVMLAEMSIGRPLWTTPTVELLFQKKLDTETSIADVPAKLKPLVRSLLSTDPAKRPTAAQARLLLRDLDAPAIRLDIELDPTPPAGPKHSRAASPDPFAKLEALGVVSLDELDGPRPKPAAVVAPQIERHDGPLATLDEQFTAPREDGPPLKLEIDRAYVAERSMKLAARRAPVTVVKKSNHAGLVVFLLIAALVGVGGYVGYNYRRDHDRKIPGGGVTISITSDQKREVRVDGNKAGITPLRLNLPTSNKLILIEADGVTPQQVTADHDQEIRLK